MASTSLSYLIVKSLSSSGVVGSGNIGGNKQKRRSLLSDALKGDATVPGRLKRRNRMGVFNDIPSQQHESGTGKVSNDEKHPLWVALSLSK